MSGKRWSQIGFWTNWCQIIYMLTSHTCVLVTVEWIARWTYCEQHQLLLYKTSSQWAMTTAAAAADCVHWLCTRLLMGSSSVLLMAILCWQLPRMMPRDARWDRVLCRSGVCRLIRPTSAVRAAHSTFWLIETINSASVNTAYWLSARSAKSRQWSVLNGWCSHQLQTATAPLLKTMSGSTRRPCHTENSNHVKGIWWPCQRQ